jgi:hypothetical protein
MRNGKKGKLCPRYISPFEILKIISEEIYKLALPSSISKLHDVFHVLMLRKYSLDATYIIKHGVLKIQIDLSYVEQLMKIIDKKEKVFKNKMIPLVLVQWQHHGP